MGTCANLQIYVRQADIPRHYVSFLVISCDGQCKLCYARASHHLFNMTWVGLTYVGLGLGQGFDLWTVHFDSLRIEKLGIKNGRGWKIGNRKILVFSYVYLARMEM